MRPVLLNIEASTNVFLQCIPNFQGENLEDKLYFMFWDGATAIRIKLCLGNPFASIACLCAGFLTASQVRIFSIMLISSLIAFPFWKLCS